MPAKEQKPRKKRKTERIANSPSTSEPGNSRTSAGNSSTSNLPAPDLPVPNSLHDNDKFSDAVAANTTRPEDIDPVLTEFAMGPPGECLVPAFPPLTELDHQSQRKRRVSCLQFRSCYY